MAVPSFAELELDPRILATLVELGYEAPTPIQAEAIPALLAGHDIIGRARTGSGKTAAFGLPLLHRLRGGGRKVRALVLTPTRELALQVSEALRVYAKNLPVRAATIYGGAPYPPQLRALIEGVTIVIGTPGRLIDHLERKSLDLSELELLVIDEADEMLRMGFIEDVQKLLAASPETRQMALFSATMPPAIRRIADTYFREPRLIQVEQEALTTEHIDQRWMEVPQRFKLEALERVLSSEVRDGTLVFARTKAGCAEVATLLAERGYSVDALHGDLSQAARELVLARLRARHVDVLIATDVAARGIDVDHLTHVINLDFPEDPETYVHRIGRTARAGRKGHAISLVGPREAGRIRTLQRILGVRIEPMQAPSDLAIRKRARTRVEGKVAAALAAPVQPALRELADELLATHAPADLLAATLGLIARADGLSFEGAADARPPAWSRPPIDRDRSSAVRPLPGRRPDERGPHERGPDERGPHARSERPRGDDARPSADQRAAADQVELFVPIGRLDQIRPQDLVGSLTNSFDVAVNDIGRITIEPRKTFFRVTEAVAKRLLADHPKLALRGREVPLTRARTRTSDEAPAEQPRAFKRDERPRPQRPEVSQRGARKPKAYGARAEGPAKPAGRPPRADKPAKRGR